MFNNPGNKYALKWTPESTMDALLRIEAEADKDNIHYLTPALKALQISPRAWSYWKQKWSADDDILDLMDIIEGIFEAKLFEGALVGKVHASTAIFGLKNNHRWSDHRETKPQAHQKSKDAHMAAPTPDREPAIITLSDGRVIKFP